MAYQIGFLSFSEDLLGVENVISFRRLIDSSKSIKDAKVKTTSSLSNNAKESRKAFLVKDIQVKVLTSAKNLLEQHCFVVGCLYGNRLDNYDEGKSSPHFLQLISILCFRVDSYRSSATDSTGPKISIQLARIAVDAVSLADQSGLVLHLTPVLAANRPDAIVPTYSIMESKLLKLRPYFTSKGNTSGSKPLSLSEIRDSLVGQFIYAFHNIDLGTIEAPLASDLSAGSQCLLGSVGAHIVVNTGATNKYLAQLSPSSSSVSPAALEVIGSDPHGNNSASSSCQSHLSLSIVTRNTQVAVVDCICLGDSFFFLRSVFDRSRRKPSFYSRFNSDSVNLCENINILDNNTRFEEFDIDIPPFKTLSLGNDEQLGLDAAKSFIADQLVGLFDQDIYSLFYGIISKHNPVGLPPRSSEGSDHAPCILVVGDCATKLVSLVSYKTKALLVRINATRLTKQCSRAQLEAQGNVDVDAQIIEILTNSIDAAFRLKSSVSLNCHVLLLWEDIDDMLRDPALEDKGSDGYYKRKLLHRVGMLVKGLTEPRKNGLSIGIIATISRKRIGSKHDYLKDIFTQCIEIPKLSASSCLPMIKSVVNITSLYPISNSESSATLPQIDSHIVTNILRSAMIAELKLREFDFNQACEFLASGSFEIMQNRGKFPSNVLQSGKESELKEAKSPLLLDGDMWGSGIVGLANVKRHLEEAIFWPKLYSSLFRALKCPAPVGILLHGPPGTGKTLLPRALSLQTKLKVSFFSIKLSDVVKGYIGEGEKLLHSTFAMAKATSPSILFIDEFQAIFSDRDSQDRDAVGGTLTSTLLSCLDGVALWNDTSSGGTRVSEKSNCLLSGGNLDGGENDSPVEDPTHFNDNFVTVIASTNTLWAIDKAFMRSGRFDKQVFVGPLSSKDRLAFLNIILDDLLALKFTRNNKKSNFSEEESRGRRSYCTSDASFIEDIVAATDKFTGADFSKLRRNLRISLSKISGVDVGVDKDESCVQSDLLNMIKSSIKTSNSSTTNPNQKPKSSGKISELPPFHFKAASLPPFIPLKNNEDVLSKNQKASPPPFVPFSGSTSLFGSTSTTPFVSTSSSTAPTPFKFAANPEFKFSLGASFQGDQYPASSSSSSSIKPVSLLSFPDVALDKSKSYTEK